MTFVEGFLAAVPTANRDAFIAHSRVMSGICRENGALRVVDCWGADVPDGKVTSFPMAVKLAEGETVAFSWIEWPDKDTRDAGWAKMMEDPRMTPEANPMPFDGLRIVMGGFDVVVDL
ncbi:MAG: DUF1428 domain-containing protein [Pseudomonadota bacterium]